MKNFLLFAGEEYCSLGGMDDFQGDFDTLREVMAYGIEYGWAHIYNVNRKCITHRSFEIGEWVLADEI